MIPRRLACDFAHRLISRPYSESHTQFWWRGSRDPYRVFVSEVLLARTRAERVVGVSKELVERWGGFCELAGAPEEELVALLSPLGLQRVRAGALAKSARRICEEHGGKLPLEEGYIAALPRAGRYVANAVLAYVACEPRVAVDANVARVFHRVFGVEIGKELHRDEPVWALAEKVANCARGCEIRRLNWALLDIGREVCRPRTVRCSSCAAKGVCANAPG